MIWDTAFGLSLYEYPTIERLYSFESPQTFEEGMVVAIEAQEDDPNVGLIKLEEMVVVGEQGQRSIPGCRLRTSSSPALY